MVYTIKKIMEDDFGCEELAEGEDVNVLILLADENGNERMIRMADRLALERHLETGSSVCFLSDGTLAQT